MEWGKRFIVILAYGLALFGVIDGFADGALPRFVLKRHFQTGGYETLALTCREDRTSKDQYSCELKRLRNGMEVASVAVPYTWTRQQLSQFVKKAADVTVPRESDHATVLSWEASADGRKAEGAYGRRDAPNEAVKALLSLEGTLAGEFYR